MAPMIECSRLCGPSYGTKSPVLFSMNISAVSLTCRTMDGKTPHLYSKSNDMYGKSKYAEMPAAKQSPSPIDSIRTLTVMAAKHNAL
ncbi:hypothetical protein KC361_g53 [Hortaea werneckii]|nr:hypothetical protein KC361_g53 [Hortaea werneckii]